MVEVTKTIQSVVKKSIANTKAKIAKYQKQLSGLEKSLKNMKVIDRRKVK